MMISSCIKCVKCESLVKRRFQKFHLEPEKLGPMALRIYALIQFYGFKFRLQVAFKFRYKFIKNNLREKHTYRILYKSFRNLVCRYLISHTLPSKPIICSFVQLSKYLLGKWLTASLHFPNAVSLYSFYTWISLALFAIIWFRISVGQMLSYFWMISLIPDIKNEIPKFLALEFNFANFVKFILTKFNTLYI